MSHPAATGRIGVTRKEIVIRFSPSAPSGGPSERPGASSGLTALLVHLDAAYNLARWLMRDETDAEDLVQDAYVRAISHFGGFRGGDTRAWLLTIVRNTCYSRLRQRAASLQYTDFDETVHSAAGRQAPNPEAALLLAEKTELAKTLLAGLPAEHREVLVLREMEQLSYSEIASVVGIPLGTVMSRLSRARQQFQQHFKRDAIEYGKW